MMDLQRKLTGLAIAGFLTATAMPATAQTSFSEAPGLTALVEDGLLPPVEERLPEDPMVVTPYDSIGEYGGSLRTVLLGSEDDPWLTKTAFYDNLVRWNFAYTDVLPNLAESWEVSPDGKSFTFTLREGVRWSDGVPFTTEDIAFWWEMFADDEINPGKDPFFTVGGSLAEFAVIDEQTFRFDFAVPNGLFLQRLASGEVSGPTGFAKHAVSKYHPAYNPDADALAQELGFESANLYLQALMTGAGMKFMEPLFPVINAWKLTTAYDAGTTVLVAERNPYYWKVDPEGNQLPYIDSITYEIGTDTASLLLKAASGGVDVLSRHINTLENKAVLIDAQDQGNYSLYSMRKPHSNVWVVNFNLTSPDDRKREIFRNKDFRIAMSHAINRPEIIETIYFGLTEPMQVAVPPGSQYYHEQLATQYLEYDVDKANALLDSVGLDQRDAEGYRLGPDGERFQISVETMVLKTEWVAVLELVAQYWDAVGIRVELDILDRSLVQAHIDANEYEAIVLWPEGGDGAELKTLPLLFVPVSIHSGMGPGWYYRYIGDPRGDEWEYSEGIAKALDAYEQMLVTPDVVKQNEYLDKMLQAAADNFYAIGIAAPLEGYGIISNRVQNFPKEGIWDSFQWPSPSAIGFAQLWIKQ